MTGRKMGWQKDEERNELCFDISANECFCLKMVPALPDLVFEQLRLWLVSLGG